MENARAAGSGTGRIGGFLLTTERHTTRSARSWVEETHRYDELIWTSAGVMRVRAAGSIWTIPAHRAIWVPAGAAHTIDAASDTILHATFFGRGAVGHLPREVVIVEMPPAVRELLLMNASDEMPDATRIRLQALVIELLRVAPAAHVDLRMPASPRLLLVAERILSSLPASESTAQWADRVGMPTRELSRAFAEETGLTLTQWRIRARVRASLVMLGSGDPVSVAARRLGYANPSTFIDHFRAIVGTTPGAYFASPERSRNGPQKPV